MKAAIKERIAILAGCIDKCERCITACQNVTSICGIEENVEYVGGLDPADSTDCAAHLGKLVKQCIECIQSCKNSIVVATEFMRTCDDAPCVVILERVVASCNTTIAACEACIEACKEDGDCFDKTEECIKNCQHNVTILMQAANIIESLGLEL